MVELAIGIVWLILMIRAVTAEFRYYRSVQRYEPAIWAQMGRPVFPKTAMIFVSKRGRAALSGVTDKRVRELFAIYRQSNLQFIVYVLTVLIVSITYFKFASV